ncbi:MAG: undecaprenyl-diphosphate phosphatase [Planctomycetes bacterium]|nr:undecaprenyl-diphosphate phosphatase [Planctomycetota bacterium]
MNIIEALILGLIQGLTEFLPVSSTGHLEIFKQVLGLEFSGSSGLSVDIVVHAGSAVAIMIFFIREFFITKSSESDVKSSGFAGLFSISFIGAVVIATVPALLAYKIFKEQIEATFTGNLTVVAICLTITGLFLIFVDYFAKRMKNRATAEVADILPFMRLRFKDVLVPWLKAFLIGVFQACALIPGISRSGATIGGGLLLRMNREHVVKFSFMLGFVAITGAVILKARDLTNLAGEVPMLSLAALFLASLISSYFALQLILLVVRVQKLRYFGIYCIIISAITFGHLFF